MDKHVRELSDYLKDYGASNIHLEGGGKHQKLCFEYGGLERSYLVAHRPSTDHHAIENNKATLRRMLGPPVPVEEKQPRRLEEMMAELNTTTAVKYIGAPPISSPSKIWHPVRLSAYQYKNTVVVYFVFPVEILQAHSEGMKIERLDDEHWKISRGGIAHFRAYGSATRLTFTDRKTAPFGAMEAEAVEADGAILVYLPLEGRLPVAPQKTPVPWPTPAALRPVSTPTPTPVPADLENQMRDIIRRIQGIEATCPYHLVRLEGGRIQWRAPIIE